MTYSIHDNGGTPFNVIITDNIVRVHITDERTPILTLHPKKIFIGKSPLIKMTKHSGDHGPDFDGNSILLEMEDLSYIHIAMEIFSFSSIAKIINFVSPVGNNDVPYPYATDEYGNIYLLMENVILKNNALLEKHIQTYDDPYSYYYDYNIITSNKKSLSPIKRYFIGEDRYTLRYTTSPETHYHTSTNGKKMYIFDTTNKIIELTKEMYITLMNSFATVRNFQPIKDKIILQERL
ncbi:MAG: DNA ligase [Harvfovirus sp.]|uniref:DNA ligase n=1 Tax=Harvfovirus sp. TaxID=2487768 RepID=A0A3G5A3M8_9VIRU|nr:MAG: DNA ligase [Harvfovirus sp.]